MFLGKSCEIWGLSLSPIEDLNHLDAIYPSSQHHGSVEYHPADKEASLGYIPFSTDPMIGERYSFFHMGSVENDQKDAPFPLDLLCTSQWFLNPRGQYATGFF